MAALAEALTLACPQGYVRVFADEGPPMAALLGRLIAAQRAGQAAAGRPARLPGPAPAGLRRRACRARHRARHRRGARHRRPADQPRAGGAGDAGGGRSNQAIAGQLVVTLNTVKKHVGHVLGKLGAANRTEAVARARELGLIPLRALQARSCLHLTCFGPSPSGAVLNFETITDVGTIMRQLSPADIRQPVAPRGPTSVVPLPAGPG